MKSREEILKNFDEEIAHWNRVVDEACEKRGKGGMEFRCFEAMCFDAMARIETLEYAKKQLEELNQ